jgi:hypothetical protein
MASALLSGRKRQIRALAGSALAQCAPGDILSVREPWIAGRWQDGRDFATSRQKAEFATFFDGWRQYPGGYGEPGRPPQGLDHKWISAVQMPDWASRMTLMVDWVRSERLHQITTADIRAEGALPVMGGLAWRWPRPVPGLHVTARRAFASYWTANHPSPGERWTDDPPVVVLGLHLRAGGD